MTRQISTSDSDYEKLREAIVRGEIAPNSRLVESDVVTTFQMSRGAVRNALIRLEQEGLVVREPHRGARVRQVSDREAVEILQARAVLEGLAVRLTAERIDEAGIERLRACLARHRELLESGDLLGASDANADLHAALLELSGHSTAAAPDPRAELADGALSVPHDPHRGAASGIAGGARGHRRGGHRASAGEGRGRDAPPPVQRRRGAPARIARPASTGRAAA